MSRSTAAALAVAMLVSLASVACSRQPSEVPTTTLSPGGEAVPIGDAVVQEELAKVTEVAFELGERAGGTSGTTNSTPTITACGWPPPESGWPKQATKTVGFDFTDPHGSLKRLADELEDEGWQVRFLAGGGKLDTTVMASRGDVAVRIIGGGPGTRSPARCSRVSRRVWRRTARWAHSERVSVGTAVLVAVVRLVGNARVCSGVLVGVTVVGHTGVIV